MTEPVTFIHLTDLHIANPDVAEPHYYTDTAATLTRALGVLRGIEPRPSFVVVSGDIANNADAAAYAELKRLWGDFDVPTLFALGNHDSRSAFREVMLGEIENAEAPYSYDRVIDGVHVIVLDTSTPRQVHGSIEPEQFDWLAGVLETNTGLPRVVVMHHPPALQPSEHGFEATDFDDSERLARMFAGKNVVAVLSGHVHYDGVAMWHGIPVVINTGHHSTADVLSRGEMRSVEGAGFARITLREAGLVVNFIPVMPERRELSRTSLEQLRQYIAALQAAE